MGKRETEDKIVQAAVEEFIERGVDGARMRAISDRAEVNKGLIHYYFKTKDVLIARVVDAIVGVLINRLNDAIEGEEDIFEIIRTFTAVYIDTVQRKPGIPRFVLTELGKNPERMMRLLDRTKKAEMVKTFERALSRAVEKDEVVDISANQLFANILSMCVFPFVGRPMIQLSMGMRNEDFEDFIEKRKTGVADFVIRAIKKH
ncbi:MAG: TetR/AcrR family transcriptional regulator [Flavobacteriales bacterium]|nr:TetR/AcrR family transcriptional regulator [Flavobacteriales bacterium]